jgi:hypothetical protein
VFAKGNKTAIISPMKLAHLFEPLLVDYKTVLAAFKAEQERINNLSNRDMYDILAVISRNRAYDDTYPAFANDSSARILPYDGRDYCWYYEGGADDTHLQTLLNKIKKALAK